MVELDCHKNAMRYCFLKDLKAQTHLTKYKLAKEPRGEVLQIRAHPI